MMNEHIETVMNRKLITLEENSTLDDAMHYFEEQRLHHLPIVKGDKLVGLITTYDLWRLDVAHSSYKDILVKDVMSKKVIKLSPSDKVGTAAELFLFNRFHALPVVEDDGRLVGMITSFDVMKYEFKKEYPKAILHKELYDDENDSKGIS